MYDQWIGWGIKRPFWRPDGFEEDPVRSIDFMNYRDVPTAMLRPVLVVVGLLETLVPNRIVESAERIAFENPDDGRLRAWTIPMARLEGLVFVWLAATGRLGSPVVRRTLFGCGILMATFPRRAVEFGLDLAYENPDELEVKPWVKPVTRGLGVISLVLVLFVGRADAPEESIDGDRP